jgi:serine protease Do
MKKTFLKIALAMLLAVSLLATTSCSLQDINKLLEMSGANQGNTDESGYITRDELDQLLAEIQQNVTVNGGDTYEDINITSQHEKNLLAASKGLLSAVSISSTFDVTYTNSWPSYSTYTQEKTTYGSGVIYKLDKIAGDAYIITNYHVVHYAGADTEDDISDNIKVYLYGMEYTQYGIPAVYIGGSPNYDIAVLKVSGSNTLKESNARAADFADSDEVSVLETAIAIGNPEAQGISATVGSVNVDSENLTMSAIVGQGTVTLRVMRIDAAVNGGNSGGGVFNDKGEVIGIVNAKITSSSIDNIGYAIPSNVAKNVADNVIYYDTLDPDNDAVYRIIMGVNVDVTRAYVEYDTETGKVHKREVVVISSVSSGSAADGALMEKDVINSITIDGVTYRVTRIHNVKDAMLAARNGSTVVINVTRNGTKMDVVVDVSKITPEPY